MDISNIATHADSTEPQVLTSKDFSKAIKMLEENQKSAPVCLCWYCVRALQNYKVIPKFIDPPHNKFLQMGRDAINQNFSHNKTTTKKSTNKPNPLPIQ